MRIAAISDTHGRQFEIPECDIFIHAGDITAGGSLPEMASFAHWLGKQDQARHKVVTFGNHDRCADESLDITRSLFQGVHVLVNELVAIEGISLWASPNTPPFMDWHFMSTEKQLANIYESMPGVLDVLITHGPPRGILDQGWNDPHVGSISLLDAVASRTGHIKHHIFGHLHAAGGKSVFNDPYGPYFHNVAACNEAYQFVNQALVLEI